MIKVNVASSTMCLEGFINFDNSVFLHLIKKAPFITRLLPEKYQKLLSEYVFANKNFDLRLWNCKKKTSIQKCIYRLCVVLSLS